PHGVAEHFCEQCGAPLIEQASALAGVGAPAQGGAAGPPPSTLSPAGPPTPAGTPAWTPGYGPGSAPPPGPAYAPGPTYPPGPAYPSGPSTPAPRTRRMTTTAWIGVAAGAVALLIIAILAVVFLTGDDEEPVALTAS